MGLSVKGQDELPKQQMAVPQLEDQDMSESSDDDEEIIALYSKLPVDLAFTLVAMNIRESDFRTLRRLRMDLDTFLTLSEEELLDLGVRQSFNLKEVMATHSGAECLRKDKVIFWKPRIKDLRISSSEACLLMKSVFAQVESLRKFLQELYFKMSVDPPINYVVTKENNSSDIFGKSAVLASILAKELEMELLSLRKKFDPSQDHMWENVKSGNLKSENEDTSTDGPNENQTERNTMAATYRRSLTVAQSAFAVTTAGAFLFGLWELRRFFISPIH